MKTMVTLNGRDGIGKTEQVQLLRGQPEVYVTKALKHYGFWPQLNASDEFDWWFEKSNFEEFLNVITNSLNARHLDTIPDKLTVHERGTKMFLAVCIATQATRLHADVDEVEETVPKEFLSRLQYNPDVETDILLVEDPNYSDYIRNLVSSLATQVSPYKLHQQEKYALYQKHLRKALGLCFGTNTEVIVVDQPIVDIQNLIRKALSDLTEINVEPLCENIEQLLCLGGMSESGKSLLGQNLHVHHGSYRLKLKYFAKTFGEDNALAHEVLRFLNMHRHIRLASVESLHNYGLPIVFKKLLGSRAKIVFLDAPQSERARRHMLITGATMEEFYEKEALKENRGALKVKTLADLVIDTSIGTPEETCNRVLQETS
jgi:hypothetical protein